MKKEKPPKKVCSECKRKGSLVSLYHMWGLLGAQYYICEACARKSDIESEKKLVAVIDSTREPANAKEDE